MSKQVDIISPSLVMTEARCKLVLFSKPVSANQDAMWVLPGNPKQIKGYSHAAQLPDVKVAVVAGSAQEAYAIKQNINPDQLVRVPDIQAGVATVMGGRAHAFAVGQFSIPMGRGVDPVVDRESPINAYGVVFRKEDQRFRDAFDKQLDLLRASGRMQEMYEKTGRSNWDMVAKFQKPADVVPSCQ